MEKLYYHNIHWYDFLIYVAYNFILSFLIIRIADAGFNLNKRQRSLILLQFQLLFFLIIIDTQLNILPHIYDGPIYSTMLESGQYPDAIGENILPFYYLSLFLSMVSLNSAVIFMFISFFVFSLAEMFFTASIKKLVIGNADRAISAFLLINIFFPAVYLLLTTPGRDAFTIFAMSIFIFQLIKYKSSLKFSPVLISGIFLSLLSFKSIPFVVMAALITWISEKESRTQLLVVIIAISILIISPVVLSLSGLDAGWMAAQRNKTLFDTGNFVYGHVGWQNYFDMLRDQLILGGQFLLAPLPIMNGYGIWQKLPWIAESIFIVLVIIWFIWLLIAKNPGKGRYWLMAIVILFILYFGSVENDLESAMRQRIPLVELFLILICSNLYKQPA